MTFARFGGKIYNSFSIDVVFIVAVVATLSPIMFHCLYKFTDFDTIFNICFNPLHVSLPAIVTHCHNSCWLSSTRDQRKWRHGTAWYNPEVAQMVEWEYFNNSVWTAINKLWRHNVHPINSLRKYRQAKTKIKMHQVNEFAVPIRQRLSHVTCHFWNSERKPNHIVLSMWETATLTDTY